MKKSNSEISFTIMVDKAEVKIRKRFAPGVRVFKSAKDLKSKPKHKKSWEEDSDV